MLIAASWWYLTSGRYVSTDDAYVQAARTMISTDIAGRVVEVVVGDNQRVTKGEVLFRADTATGEEKKGLPPLSSPSTTAPTLPNSNNCERASRPRRSRRASLATWRDCCGE